MFKLLGNIFIDILKMIVSLIVFASVVPRAYHIHDSKKLVRNGRLKTVVHYLCTILIDLAFRLACSFLFKPGAGLPLAPLSIPTASTNYSFLTFIILLIPVSPIVSFAEGTILQIIVFSMFFAYAILLSGEKGNLLLQIIESFAAIMYSLAHFIIKFVPYGVFALIATAVGSIGLKVVFPLVKFLIANYIVCFLPIFLLFNGSIGYLATLEVVPIFQGRKDAILLTYTTSKNRATLPASLEYVREHWGVSRDISGLILSLGSTINMNSAGLWDGT